MWKKRLIQALWITTGIATVVLLGAAMNQKSHKVCTNVKIEITGAEQHMFIDEKDVLNILNNGGEIRGRDIANIELRSMEEMLEKNPWVRNAEMFFDNQQVLMVTIEERQPIARVFTISGKSFYLDTAAMHLPLSEKISARVPVFTGFTSDKKVMAQSDSLLMKDVVKLGKFIMADSFWTAQIAQVDITPQAMFEIIPTIGNHIVAIGNANNLEAKFSRLYTFYKEAWLQNGINKYEKLDVQFNNQIVAVKKGTAIAFVDSAKAIQVMNEVVKDTSSAVPKIEPIKKTVLKDTTKKVIPKPITKKQPIIKKQTKAIITVPVKSNKPKAVMNKL